MSKFDSRPADVRIEIVTAAFVASGRPEGIHDLGRLLENLNNPAIGKHIELADASLRPLYRGEARTPLDAALLVRRDEIVFANFEGPFLTHHAVRPPAADTPALLLAPPFQIQGTVALAPGAVPVPALRTIVGAFFLVKQARVFDADGNPLGEGEQIIVNGAAVQMTAATTQHIPAVDAAPRATAAPHRFTPVDEPATHEQAVARAA